MPWFGTHATSVRPLLIRLGFSLLVVALILMILHKPAWATAETPKRQTVHEFPPPPLSALALARQAVVTLTYSLTPRTHKGWHVAFVSPASYQNLVHFIAAEGYGEPNSEKSIQALASRFESVLRNLLLIQNVRSQDIVALEVFPEDGAKISFRVHMSDHAVGVGAYMQGKPRQQPPSDSHVMAVAASRAGAEIVRRTLWGEFQQPHVLSVHDEVGSMAEVYQTLTSLLATASAPGFAVHEQGVIRNIALLVAGRQARLLWGQTEPIPQEARDRRLARAWARAAVLRWGLSPSFAPFAKEELGESDVALMARLTTEQLVELENEMDRFLNAAEVLADATLEQHRPMLEELVRVLSTQQNLQRHDLNLFEKQFPLVGFLEAPAPVVSRGIIQWMRGLPAPVMAPPGILFLSNEQKRKFPSLRRGDTSSACQQNFRP